MVTLIGQKEEREREKKIHQSAHFFFSLLCVCFLFSAYGRAWTQGTFRVYVPDLRHLLLASVPPGEKGPNQADVNSRQASGGRSERPR